MMQARDASGRQVSLLNDDASSHHRYYSSAPPRHSHRTSSYYTSSARSDSSPSDTPELLRSDSYDSRASLEPVSPLSPGAAYADYGHLAYSPYDEYASDAHAFAGSKRPESYDDDVASPSGAASERPGKRYPCRYRDSHGCEKTFTTSGHASRHSKIHTAEKAVPCSFHGCSKKFTRADNMKQHLETHYKDKSRSSSSRPALAVRGSNSSKSSSSSRRSDSSSGAWDMRGLNLPLLSRPSAARTPSSGLDALAMAVACQEGEV